MLEIKKFDHPQPYEPIWEAMRVFTNERTENSADQLWLMEHQPVFTLGQAGNEKHILHPQKIPVVRCDRGGQVTYHGPGQLMIYCLFDLKRLGLTTRQYVHKLEQCMIDFLTTLNIEAESNAEAPGVYVKGAKICSIGLRVRRHCSYHGLAFNLDMDLSPFRLINPCGFSNLRMTQLADHIKYHLEEVIDGLLPIFSQQFGYQSTQWITK